MVIDELPSLPSSIQSTDEFMLDRNGQAYKILASEVAPIGGSMPVSKGGTGATNASDARTNLGLGAAAVEDVVPVSKGGTGASSASAARTNLGIIPTLLWTNPSPRESFAEQTLTDLDLSDWNLICVRFLVINNGSSVTEVTKLLIDSNITEGKSSQALFLTFGAGASYLYSRIFYAAKASSYSVKFLDGKNKQVSASASATTDNDKMVPYQIYGLM